MSHSSKQSRGSIVQREQRTQSDSESPEGSRGARLDEGWAGVLLGGVDGRAEAVKVGVAVLDVLHVPAQGHKPCRHILSEGDLRVAVDGDPA